MLAPTSRSSTVAVVIALMGCAHGKDSSRAKHDAFTAFECGRDATQGSTEDEAFEAELRVRGAAPTLAAEVDYARLIVLGPGDERMTFGERGTACAAASDDAACQARITALESAARAGQSGCSGDACSSELLILTTRGDEVATLRGPDQVIAFLGAIDTPADAWLVLMAREAVGPYGCAPDADSGYRAVPGGFELRRRPYTQHCRPVVRSEIITRVDQAGRVTQVSTAVIERDAERCIRD